MTLEELDGEKGHLAEADHAGLVKAKGGQVAAIHRIPGGLCPEQAQRNFFEVAVVNLWDQGIKTFTCIQLFAYFETAKNTE
jgi:hypothetical protein